MTIALPTATDRPAKIARLRGILDAHHTTALSLTRPESLSWLFDGARVAVPYGGPAVCTAVVRRDGECVVVAPANEADRLRAEEFGDDVEVRAVPWWHPLPDAEPGTLREDDHLPELRAARAVLLPLERTRYERLGAETAHAVGDELRRAHPGEREQDLAARLAAAVMRLGAEPVVILVAGGERTGIPHPLPTEAPLGRRAMAVVGARRHGLVVNLTRWVSFGTDASGAPSAIEAALLEVEADAFAATLPGRPMHAVLSDIARSYERHGFGAEAWLRHHQGGPTGYLGRDPKATPHVDDVVHAGQAFAWNPWVPGAKLEDTVVIDGAGIQVLTFDPSWPAADVRGVPRPLTLSLD